MKILLKELTKQLNVDKSIVPTFACHGEDSKRRKIVATRAERERHCKLINITISLLARHEKKVSCGVL